MAFDWMQPTLMVFSRPLSLFLAWNDETKEIMFMNSDKLEWAWSPLEFVGTTAVGTFRTAGEAADAMSSLVVRIEQGDCVVTRTMPSARDIRRWSRIEWVDPLDASPYDAGSFERWTERCSALGGLTQAEVAQLVAGL